MYPESPSLVTDELADVKLPSVQVIWLCEDCRLEPGKETCGFCGRFLCEKCHAEHLQRVADDMDEGFPGHGIS